MAIAPFAPETTVDELYLLGSSALLAGNKRNGMRYLRFAAQRATPRDSTYIYLKEMEGLNVPLDAATSPSH